ncbi:MAG: hypothetical protein H6741_35345 [Alphaproteobacteria bacterium]|nr:hypothetical protein [Alphaproteobacteria bacterium]
MGLSPSARAMLGVVTVLLYSAIAVMAWQSWPAVTVVFAGLAALRAWLLVRQWPRKQSPDDA